MKSLPKQLWIWLLIVAACLLPRIAAAQAQDVYNFGTVANDANSASALTLSGTTLYGTSAYGGSHSQGTIFQINTDGTGYKVIYNFGTGTNDGTNPSAALTLVGSTLYGTTNAGGSNGKGTIFQINTDGLGYRPLYSFDTGDNDGTNPSAALTLVGSTLYGTTSTGGSNGAGTIFQISTAGSGYQVLYSFGTGANDGLSPSGALALSGTTLYGTTNYGGQFGDGTIYEFNTVGSVYNSMQSISGFESQLNQVYGLTLVGSTLYGTTNVFLGDSNYIGTIFQINTDGSDYQVLYDSDYSSTAATLPSAGLTLVGSTLYGVTYGTGLDGVGNAPGTIFHFDPSVTPIQLDYDVNFGSATDSSGTSGPDTTLTLVDGSTLYGVSFLGGTLGNGCIFKFNLPDTSVIQVTASPLAGGAAGTSGTYLNGSIATVTATPASGYVFVNWTVLGNQVSTSSSYQFTVAGNEALVANFVPGPLDTVTATAGANGGIDPSGAVAAVNGQSVTFTATPSSGYLVNQWLLDGSVVQTGGGAYTLNNVTASHTLQVTFVVPTATGTTSDGFAYEVANGEATITGYTGSGGTVSIPSTINTWPVTAIGQGAFSGVTNPTSISIPSSVTSIGTGPFTDCLSLTSITVDPANPSNAYIGVDGVLFNQGQTTLIQYPVSKLGASYTIPNSVTTIGNSAFGGSAFLTSVTIPNGVTTIGDSAFFAVPLNSVTIPNSVTSIGEYVFEDDVNMITATIGSGLPSAGYGSFAFSNCANLTTVNYYGYPPTDSTVFEVDTKVNSYYFVSDATLSALTLSGVTLTPAFSGATTNYTATVPYATTSTTVAATATGSFGGATVSGSLGSQVLSVGPNPFSLQVTAVDGTPETYTVTVTRDPLTSYTVTPSAGTGGSISPNTVQTVAGGSNVIFTASPAVYYGVNQWLVNGVVAQSGGTTFTLSNITANDTVGVTFTRLSSVDTLSSLKVSAGPLTPAFSASVHAYTLTVLNTTPSEAVTPTVTAGSNATVAVNGTPVTSGSPSGAITLSPGVNAPIQVVVTAQDGVTIGTYTIAVTQLIPPTVTTAAAPTASTATTATLSGTINANGTSTAASFAYGKTTSYGSTVAAKPSPVTGSTTTTVSATLTGLTPSTLYHYQLNGVSAAGSSPFPGGDATFTTPSNVDTLSGLVLSSGPLTPAAFSSTTTAYTATVSNATASVTLTPTLTNANATVTVNGSGVTSGSASSAISLNFGSNPILVVVIAQDGTTTKTYTVTVTRTALLATMSTLPVGGPSTTTVTLNGTAVANNASTVLSFDYGTSASYGSNIVATPATATGTASTNMSATLTGLKPGTLYYYRAKGVNLAGTAYATGTFTTINNVATLSGLKVSPGILTPAFSTSVHAYTVTVPSTTPSETITPTVTAGSNATVTVNTSAVTSGSASGAITLSPGVNSAIPVVVTAQDGVTTGTYTITVTQLIPPTVTTAAAPTALTATTATLSGTINANGTSTAASFAYGKTTSYGSTVAATPSPVTGNTTTTVSVKITGLAPSTTYHYQLNGVSAASSSPFPGGDATFTTPSNVDTLSGLVLSSGPLTPAVFSSTTIAYTATVSNTTASVTLTPTVTNANATVTVNGSSVTSGNASGAINLNVGSNPILVVVTAQDGTTTKTYTVTVTRTILKANMSTLAATSVGTTTATLNGTAVANNASTALSFDYGTSTSYGSNIAATPATANGVASTGISATLTALKPGTAYHYRAQGINVGGTATGNDMTFTTVNTLATLSGLKVSAGILTPAFSTSVHAYTVTVPSTTPSEMVTPTVTAGSNATVTVNTNSVASGSASGAITLSPGVNSAIQVVVTAQDGVTTGTYTITVTQLIPPTVTTAAAPTALTATTATLSGMINANGTSTTASFAYGKTTSYGSTVAATPSPVTGSTTATVSAKLTGLTPATVYHYQLNGVSAASSSPFPGGDVMFTTPSNVDTLSGLVLSSGTLSPAFSSATISYTTTVSSTTASVTLTPTVTNANATVTVNGSSVTSGGASGAISLNVGSNAIHVVVTAQDGTTTKTYTLTATRTAMGQMRSELAATGAGETNSPSKDTATAKASANVPATAAPANVAPVPIKAQLTGPVDNGGVLPGATAAFTWNAGRGVSEYWLSVGSTVGGTDLYDGSQGAALSHTVTLPTDGEDVYVTLHSMINGAWLVNNYVFTTANTTTKAALTGPVANGGVLPGAATGFTWSAGTGVSAYWLSVGSTVGGTDLYDGNQGLALSRTVTLPTNGEAVYVALRSMINGLWLANSYAFSAADTTKAVLITPADQSVLPEAVTVFTWDSVPGAAAYWLSIGSTLGGTDLYDASQGVALTQSVTLPTDGRELFVTLKTSINGQWLASNTTLTASGGVTPVAAQPAAPVPSAFDSSTPAPAPTSPASGSSAPAAAELTSPADHVVLSGSPVTFTWNAGTGVSEYWLSLGSSTVATDLYSASQGSNNKVTIAVPTDGSPLYVTLSSLIDGQWQSNQYLYQAALPP